MFDLAIYFMHMAANITVTARTIELGRPLAREEEMAIWDDCRFAAQRAVMPEIAQTSRSAFTIQGDIRKPAFD
jgi:hypothetical protein